MSRVIPLAVAQLGDGFFRVQVSRTSDGERRYLRAMAELTDSVTESRLVAELLATTTQSLAPTRDNLMRKALCYSPRRGQIAFTVPSSTSSFAAGSPAHSPPATRAHTPPMCRHPVDRRPIGALR